MTLDLTIDDQDDPRLLALKDWWQKKMDAESDARRAKNSGDPFTMA